jgi:hypothetical protein
MRKDEQRGPASFPALDEALTVWYRDFIGDRVEIPGSPLEYEPRAAWACSRCHSILVGTKSGAVYRVTGQHVSPVPHAPTVAVQAVHGCLNPGCQHNSASSEYRAVVGDRAGRIYAFRADRDDPLVRELGPGVDGVTAIRQLLDPAGRDWCLVATGDRSLRLVPLAGACAPPAHPLPRNMRSVMALSGPLSGHKEPRDPRLERRWLLISTDGHVSSARVSWEDVERGDSSYISRFDLGRLRHPPLCVAAERRYGQIRAVLYGSEHGLHIATIERDGIRRERDLLHGHRVQYVRIAPVFDVRYLLACGPGGVIKSRTWEHADDTDATWQTWPALPSDAMYVDVSAPDENDPSVVHAVVLVRTHEAFRMPLHNIELTQKRLREDPAPATIMGRAFEPVADRERYAEITALRQKPGYERLLQLTRQGGARTLEAVIASLTDDPRLTERQVVQLSVEVLKSAVELGHERVRALAHRLHAQLLVLLRDMPITAKNAKDQSILERWIVFLKKHYTMAHTFSEKRTALDRLVTVNHQRRSPDALIYGARLLLQGFDVSSELPIASPVLAMTRVQSSEEGAGGQRLAASFADGSIRLLRIGDKDRLLMDRVVFEQRLPPGGDTERVFRNYSRVLHLLGADDGRARLFAAFRQPLDEPLPPEVVVPPAGDDVRQVYSVHDLCDGRLLLGLRDLRRPFALFHVADGTISEINATWGTERHVQSRLAGGERRIWSVDWLDSAHACLAVAAEDGYLRFGRLSEAKFDLFAGRGEYLRSAVRSLASWQGNRRRLLFAGTQQAELFCFEVAETGDIPRVRLKFRDLMRRPIISLFVTELEPGHCELCVLEESGRLTTFDVEGNGPGRFLSRRIGHHKISDGATTALSIGQGRVMVASWNVQQARGWIRLVNFASQDGRLFRSWDCSPHITTAVNAVLPLIKPHQDISPRDGASDIDALDFLASIPLDDPAIRKAVASERVRSAWPGGKKRRRRGKTVRRIDPIGALTNEALKAYPGNREEMKTLLDELVSQLETAPDRERATRFAKIHELFIGPRTLTPGLRDAKLQATIVRRLLNVEVLRLWRRTAADEEQLQAWVDRHLQHSEAFVRVDTLRALSEALLDLLRRRALSQDAAFREIFPSRAPVASAGWLLDVIARFLYSHPSTLSGTECDASTWAAVSVLVNLVRLFPDSVLVICAYLTLARAHPMVFRVLASRLNAGGQDAHILRRLDRFIPSMDPSLRDIKHHCEPFAVSAQHGYDTVQRELSAGESDPDAAYLRAYSACYHWLWKMSFVASTEELIELRQEQSSLGDELSIPETLKDLWPEGKPFLHSTARWIEQMRTGLATLGGPDNEKARDDFARRLEEMQQDLERGTAGEPLFEPERGIAIRIVEHWRGILNPPPPATGQLVGHQYRLGRWIPGSRFVFELEGDPGMLAAIAVTPSPQRRRALRRVWEKAQAASHDKYSRLPWVESVADSASGLALVMQRIPGETLARAWSRILELGNAKRAALARACMIDVSYALTHLRGQELFHGDVQPSNIVWDEERRGFVLVDFENTGDRDLLDLHPSFHRGSAAEPQRFEKAWSQQPEGVPRSQVQDCMALVQICYLLVARRPWPMPYDGNLPQGEIPTYLEPWLLDLRKRWEHPQTEDWNADALRAAAVSARTVFVAGASHDTRSIREQLCAVPIMSPWAIQGHWPEQPVEPLVSTLYARVRDARIVVLLIGGSAGSPMPHVPLEFVDDARQLGFDPATYLVCEYLIAKALKKKILAVLLTDLRRDPQAAAMLQGIVVDLEKDGRQLVETTSENAVNEICDALRNIDRKQDAMV